MNYQEFIEKKTNRHEPSGFEINQESLSSHLKDFQKWIVQRSLQLGRSAIFADCGLGKTLMQLEWAYHVGHVLIVAPLAVKGQTVSEAQKFGIDLSKIDVCNYEQLDNYDSVNYDGVVLDESSILKNFEGKFRNKLINKFSQTPYKLACTATPSPNDHMELGNHAEFLDIMNRNEMLAMYFLHDGGDTSQWRLKNHAKDEFWRFVSSWATMVNSPSDLGFDGSEFVLPELNYHEHEVKVQASSDQLFAESSVNATGYNQKLRNTMDERINKAIELANKDSEQYIVWVNQNAEAEKLKGQINGAVEVRGNEKPEAKEDKLLGFANKDYRVLITKKKIAQFGLNFQSCPNQIHASLDFSFESFYQAVRRSYRFGQKYPVNIYLITTNTMHNVKRSLEQKQKQFEEMQANMASYCVSSLKEQKATMDKINQKSGPDYNIYQGDSIELLKELESNSVDLSVFSPPFSELYVYNDSPQDLGNSRDYDEFESHFAYMIPELKRVVKPGRNICVHCMDLPIQKGKEGYIGLRDFPSMLIRLFERFGFIYHSKVTIWKNPVTEMTRTKALGLLHKQVKKDSVMNRVGLPDYLITFRNEGENQEPIKHQDEDPNKPNYLPVDLWQKYASPVWMDIDYSETLNTSEGKDSEDEKHVCPLQLPTIERCVHLWSNEGENILDPFAGIGSSGYKSLQLNRKFTGIELKEAYFETMDKNLRRAKEKNSQLQLF